MQRGLVWIGGVAVICVAAFLYFGLDGSEPEEASSEIAGARQSEAGDLASPAGEQTRASRVAAAREKRKAARERSRQKAKAKAAAAEAAGTEAGSSRAAAERRREGGTEAGGGREPRSEALSDRAQIEALFRAAAEAPRQEAPSQEASEAGEGDPESQPGKESVGRATVMKCETDPWICDFFPLAFQLPGTIPVVSDGIEAVYITFGSGGEIWIRMPDIVVRLETPRLTSPRQVSKAVSNYFN